MLLCVEVVPPMQPGRKWLIPFLSTHALLITIVYVTSLDRLRRILISKQAKFSSQRIEPDIILRN